MNKDLQSYIKIYNVIEPKICNQTIKEIKKSKNWQQHKFYNVTDNSSLPRSGEQELSIVYEDVSTSQQLMEKCWYSIQNYINDIQFPWFSAWQGHSYIRFNEYKKNKKMAKHCDHIHSMFDGNIKGIPILSIVGLLNNNYEGGEFVMFEDEEIKLTQGDIMIFPSIFLYPHRVDPVTKGTRYSFVSWVW